MLVGGGELLLNEGSSEIEPRRDRTEVEWRAGRSMNFISLDEFVVVTKPLSRELEREWELMKLNLAEIFDEVGDDDAEEDELLEVVGVGGVRASRRTGGAKASAEFRRSSCSVEDLTRRDFFRERAEDETLRSRESQAA